MQTIYIDTLICVNLIIDYLILCLVKKILRVQAKMIRTVLGAAVGAGFSLIIFVPVENVFLSVILNLLISTIVICLAFGFSKPKLFIIRLLTYFGISILFFGIITVVWLLLKPKSIVLINGVVYLDISPVFLIIMSLLCFSILSIYEKIRSKQTLDTKIHKVTIYTFNSTYSFDSLVDTGCNLTEPFSGLPVIIADRDLIDEDIPKEKKRLIPYSTLAGEGALYGFKPDKVEIDGKELEKGCYIAICDGNIQLETKSLMGNKIREEI